MTVNIGYVSDGYGDVAGMKLSAGRWPTPTSKNEIAVNKSFAVDYFALENPIGQAIRLRSRPGNTADVWVVVGVVKDVRQNIRVTPGYHLYAPESWRAQEMTTFIVEMAVDNSQNLTDVVRRAIYKVNPDIVTIQVSSLTQLRDQQLYYERYSSSVLNVLSAIALLLTTTGTFSVVAYTVEQRMQEFGIRLALGATPNALQKLVFSDGMTIVLVGIVLGMSFAAVLARFLESLLFETPRNDPFVLAAVALTISLVSAGACTIPAYRATRANAADLLRVG
jgi:putative ABC transport system permease protein